MPVSALSLRPRREWALFLDVDGTLLHFADTPDGVRRSERVCRILESLRPCLDGALALVSGRPIEILDGLFAPHRLPVAGQHGLQRRDAFGLRHDTAVSDAIDRLRSPLNELARTVPGALLEQKSHALAVHYRRTPGRAVELRSSVNDLVRSSAPELQVVHGSMVIEIKPRNADKGSAIREFMKETPFSGRSPVFIGDDTTDEDGFACVNALNGHAIRVGKVNGTAARYRLPGVDEVVDWLAAWPPLLRKGDDEQP